jgi:hypothetical protein
METGTSISIAIGGAVAHSAVICAMLHGTISRTTEKAVCVTFDNKSSLWFPKSALIAVNSIVNPGSFSHYKTARWFRMDEAAARIADRAVSISGVSAA